MVCSCESFFTATLAAGAGANVAVPGLPSTASGGGAPGVAGPGVAGAVCPGRLAGVGWTGGFGPKNFAQRMITANDNSEATRIRSSGVNLSFCPGALMSAPQSSRSEEHTSELQSHHDLVCRLLLEKKKRTIITITHNYSLK